MHCTDRTAVPTIQAFVDAADGPAFVKDIGGTYLVANAALASALGLLDVGGLIGRRDEDLLASTIAAEIRAADQAVIDAGHALSIEAELRPSIPLAKNTWRDVNGQVIGVAGIARDLTGSVGKQLQESENCGVRAGGWADRPSDKYRRAPCDLAWVYPYTASPTSRPMCIFREIISIL